MRQCLYILLALLICLAHPISYAYPKKNELSPDVQAFIAKMSRKHFFKKKALNRIFRATTKNNHIIALMHHPFERQPWYRYKQHFLTPQKIKNGVLFWKKHHKVLSLATQKFGVPAAIILAIIGVETNYGEFPGTISVLQSLSTLAFDLPKRAAFFKYQLEAYLSLCRQQHFNPSTLKGSYAGAIGIPQFMPSTYQQYAIGYKNPAHADLIHNPNDAIFSVAHFLVKNGWQSGQPIARAVMLDKHTHKNCAYNQYNIFYNKNGQQIHRVCIEQAAQSPQYWDTFQNFHAILSYNPRINYAMAIFQLSEALQHARSSFRTETISSASIASSRAI